MLSALFLALNLCMPQYTALAPAAIADFMESISPPGARISILCFNAVFLLFKWIILIPPTKVKGFTDGV